MKRELHLPLLASGLLLALTSCASTGQPLGGGSTELDLSGDIQRSEPDEGEATDSVTLGIGYSTYTANNLSFGFKLFQNVSTTDDIESGYTNLLLSPRWYFASEGGGAVPYVGPDVGVTTFVTDDESADGSSIGGVAGLKFFNWDSAAIFTELYTLENTFDDFDNTQSGLRFGVSVFF